MCGIIKGQNGVAECGGKIATTLAPLNNYLWNLLQCLHGMFTFANMHKSDRSSNDSYGMHVAFTHQVANLEECRWGIAHHIECFGIFLCCQLHAGLTASDAFLVCHLLGTRVVDVTMHFDAQSLQSTLADTAGSHRDVGNDMFQTSVNHLII